MPTVSILSGLDRPLLGRIADGLVVAVAVSLPWSTSATSILLVLWLLALLPTLDVAGIRREFLTMAGGLPVLLVALGVMGMLWADVSLIERWKGLGSFFKLLVIPLLFVQFRRSDRGVWVFGGYLASCTALWAISTIVLAIPSASSALMHPDSVLVKNAPTQSGEFVTCIFGLLFLAFSAFERRHWGWLLALLVVAFGMLANIFFVAAGRTALVIIPVLLILLAAKMLNGKGVVIVCMAAIVIGTVGWMASPYLRERTGAIWTDIQKYKTTGEITSNGERIEFWKKSVTFVGEAPIIGHGTGMIESLFAKAAIGRTGAAASATTNPHNQTFAVAIQLGLVGAAILWAMWIAHLLLFRGAGLAEWVGLVIVVQNIVGSLFNSHLFDFGQGWIYVLGVGVAGGMASKGLALKNRAAHKAAGM